MQDISVAICGRSKCSSTRKRFGLVSVRRKLGNSTTSVTVTAPYDFFDQCPLRMACAKCSFYLPKESTAAALLEGKSNLLRMRQEIPLSDAELAALDDGVSALESLLNRLANVPTPALLPPVHLPC